jgi:hypothetical protein
VTHLGSQPDMFAVVAGKAPKALTCFSISNTMHPALTGVLSTPLLHGVHVTFICTLALPEFTHLPLRNSLTCPASFVTPPCLVLHPPPLNINRTRAVKAARQAGRPLKQPSLAAMCW